jgi:hypothetical protein
MAERLDRLLNRFGGMPMCGALGPRTDAVREQEDGILKNAKPFAYRWAFKVSSLVALAVALGAGRKFG